MAEFEGRDWKTHFQVKGFMDLVHRVRNRGIKIYFVAPFCPDLHFIELCFGWDKARMKDYSQNVDWRSKHIVELNMSCSHPLLNALDHVR